MLPPDPDWIRLCADRLQPTWPTVARDDLIDTAYELMAHRELREMAPGDAADAWLRRGVASEV